MHREGEVIQWDKPAKKPGEEEPPRKTSFVGRLMQMLLLTAVLGGGVAIYLQLARHSTMQGTLPLPKPLRTTSAAHDDLLLLCRAFEELGREAERFIAQPTRSSPERAGRMAARLNHLKKTARELEPKLTREETRALNALRMGERPLGEYLTTAHEKGRPGPPTLLMAALSQIGHATELARGKEIDDMIVDALRQRGVETGRP